MRSCSVLHDSNRRQTLRPPTWKQRSALPASPDTGSSGTLAKKRRRSAASCSSRACAFAALACSACKRSRAALYSLPRRTRSWMVKNTGVHATAGSAAKRSAGHALTLLAGVALSRRAACLECEGAILTMLFLRGRLGQPEAAPGRRGFAGPCGPVPHLVLMYLLRSSCHRAGSSGRRLPTNSCVLLRSGTWAPQQAHATRQLGRAVTTRQLGRAAAMQATPVHICLPAHSLPRPRPHLLSHAVVRAQQWQPWRGQEPYCSCTAFWCSRYCQTRMSLVGRHVFLRLEWVRAGKSAVPNVWCSRARRRPAMGLLSARQVSACGVSKCGQRIVVRDHGV